MFKYICNYQRREPSGMLPNQQSLSFDVWDTKLSRAWAEVIRRKLSEPDVTPSDYSLHNSFPAFNNKYELFENISKNVQTARKLCPDLEWPDSMREIDQTKLNYLHERFHEAQEFLLKDEDIVQKMHDAGVTHAFIKINHDIHAFENLLELEQQLEKKQTSARQSYSIINFGPHDKHLRLPVTNELRQEFFCGEVELPEYKPAILRLGYATVGKNMFHCVRDDDAQVVRDGMVRPQLDIGGETMMVIFGGDVWQKPDPSLRQLRLDQRRQDLEDFMNRHQLHKYIDHTLPEHQNATQPIIGVVSAQHDSWTERDYYTLFTEYKLVSVELKEQN